ncbi:hypothetical protein BLOT_008670 [Blomia tropicalis]|nr:hypothetical protein BLOT_008670 [Blomia tropicalis]
MSKPKSKHIQGDFVRSVSKVNRKPKSKPDDQDKLLKSSKHNEKSSTQEKQVLSKYYHCPNYSLISQTSSLVGLFDNPICINLLPRMTNQSIVGAHLNSNYAFELNDLQIGTLTVFEPVSGTMLVLKAILMNHAIAIKTTVRLLSKVGLQTIPNRPMMDQSFYGIASKCRHVVIQLLLFDQILSQKLMKHQFCFPIISSDQIVNLISNSQPSTSMNYGAMRLQSNNSPYLVPPPNTQLSWPLPRLGQWGMPWTIECEQCRAPSLQK